VVKSATHTDLLKALREKPASGRVSIYGSTRTDTKTIEKILRRSAALEAALRESEERFRLAQQAARIGTFELNLKTGVNKWTPELEEMYGLGPGDFGGTRADWEALLHPDDRDETVRGVDEAITNGPFEKEFRIVRMDGSVRWMLARASTLKRCGRCCRTLDRDQYRRYRTPGNGRATSPQPAGTRNGCCAFEAAAAD
jgi:PAS domain S-box-containing protein